MTHLTDDQLLSAVARGAVDGRADRAAQGHAEHQQSCAACQARVAAMGNLATAARIADQADLGSELGAETGVQASPWAVPAFDALLGPALAATRQGTTSQSASVGPNTRADPLAGQQPQRSTVDGSADRRTAWWSVRLRLALTIVWRQVLVLPRALGPLTAVGLLGTIAIAIAVPSPIWGIRLFSTCVTLLILIGALTMCSSRDDPGSELLFAMPIPPGTVFLARLTLVLASDLVAAMLASVAASLLGLPIGPIRLATTWLGPSLLSAGIAVVLAVHRSPWVGSLVGTTVWLIGSVMTLPRQDGGHGGLGRAVAMVWTTAPWTPVVSGAMFAIAVWLVNRPSRSLSGPG